MAEKFVRIDDRLYHGQTAAVWLPLKKPQSIVIADDFASTDYTTQLMIKLAVPKTVNLVIKNIVDAAKYIKENDNESMFVIVRHPKAMLQLLEEGFTVDKINLGNISNSKSETGRKTLLKNIHVEQNDVDCIRKIADKGVRVEIQLVPDDIPIDAIDLLNKNY